MMRVVETPDLAAAKRVRARYNRRLREISARATRGDKQAALDLIGVLADFNNELHATGYRETDETEPGRVNRLVVITQEYLDEKQAKKTELERMADQIRQAEDEGRPQEEIRELMRTFVRQYAMQ